MNQPIIAKVSSNNCSKNILRHAVWTGSIDEVQTLIADMSLDINEEGINGYTSLMLAVRKKYLAIVDLFLAQGSILDIDIQNDDGYTARWLQSRLEI